MPPKPKCKKMRSFKLLMKWQGKRELQEEVRKLAMKRFEVFISDALNYTPVFKWIGIQMIRFAKKEPKLFQVLFMRELEDKKSFEQTFEEYLGDTANVCIESIQKEHELTWKEAYTVFQQSWLHTFAAW